MSLPFTADQFYAVFGAYDTAVWPMQWALMAAAAAAAAAVLRPRAGSGRAVSAILGLQWVWMALAHHLGVFARISSVTLLPGVWPELGLIATGAVGLALLWPRAGPRRTRTTG